MDGSSDGMVEGMPSETFTGKFLTLLAAAMFSGPISPVFTTLMRPDAPISLQEAAVITVGFWIVGGILLIAGMTWPKWRPGHEVLAGRLSAVANSLWAWTIVFALIAFGPAISVAYFAKTTSPASSTTPANSQVTSPSGGKIPTFLRLQFDAYGNAEEISKANLSWKAINPEQAQLTTVPFSGAYPCPDGSKSYAERQENGLGSNLFAPAFCLTKSKSWIFVLVFDKPISMRKIRLDPHGATLPAWENSETDSTFSILTIHGELKNLVLDVHMMD